MLTGHDSIPPPRPFPAPSPPGIFPAPLIIQFPYINWSAILDMLGEANNIPDFAKVVLNAQGLQLIQAGTMPGQAAGAMTYGMPQLPPGSSPMLQQAGMGGGFGVMPQSSFFGSGGGAGASAGVPAPSGIGGPPNAATNRPAT